MKQIPYFNDTTHTVFVGGVMVPAGESRLVDARLLPQHEVHEPAPEQADPLAELLKGTVAEVVAKLPELEHDDLERLGELEQLGQARKGILGPIAETLLATASKANGGSLDEQLKGESDAQAQ